MPGLNRVEKRMTEQALSMPSERGDRAMEERISVIMGAEERAAVTRAEFERAEHWAAMMERERCARIAEYFRPNLCARHIAEKIREGR